MTLLLDANLLIALTNQQHVHHSRARSWFAAGVKSFATCPITQGALLRHYYRDVDKAESDGAVRILKQIEAMPSHEFWQDTIAYTEVRLAGVIGHRQVTDAYLVSLAMNHGGKLATMDKGLALMHDKNVVYVE